MKKSLHPIALLLLFFLLGATSAAAQGVYIYKNGKKQVFHASEVDSLVFFENDDSTDPSVTPAPLQLPTAQFGADINDLITAEQARGFTVSKTDDTHLTLTKTENGETFNWIYTFDASQSYKYAKCAIPAGGEEAFKASLRKAGYELRPEASRNAEVLVYVNETSKTVIFINKTGAQADTFSANMTRRRSPGRASICSKTPRRALGCLTTATTRRSNCSNSMLSASTTN